VDKDSVFTPATIDNKNPIKKEDITLPSLLDFDG
jgi:hypothetical protein